MKKIYIILLLLFPVMLFGQTIMKTDSLYKVERIDYGGNPGSVGVLMLYGDSVEVDILGCQVLPDSTIDMVSLYTLILPAQDTCIIDSRGAYAFQRLPNFVYLNGVADKIELIGYKATNLGVLP